MQPLSKYLGLVAISAYLSCFSSETVKCGKDGPTCPVGWACIAELSACINPLETQCGNGVVDEGEECDDGNFDNRDDCNWDCRTPRCGDGFIRNDRGEVCDDANTGSGDGCSSDCGSSEICGDGIINTVTGEACDSGSFCSDLTTPCATAEDCEGIGDGTCGPRDINCCTFECKNPDCGNGVVERECADSHLDRIVEVCDFGSQCENGQPCVQDSDCGEIGDRLCRARDNPNCSQTCLFGSPCGDGIVNRTIGEVCDGGRFCADLTDCVLDADCAGKTGDELCLPRNTVRCTVDCRSEGICGDGILNDVAPYLEVCDDGKQCDSGLPCKTNADCGGGECTTRGDDGCSADCKATGRCGDGETDLGEACDDGNRIDGDGCSGDCRNRCGDGVLHAAEGCDDGQDCADGVCNGDTRACLPSCERARCGDRLVQEGVEDCDSGAIDSEECNQDCTVADCGDGYRNVAAGEECDSQGVNTVDCNENCAYPRCGDSITNRAVGERCDDGNRDNLDGCSADCTSTELCGDGVTNFAVGEVCDNGATCDSGGVCEVDADCAEGELCLPRSGDNCSKDCRSSEICGDGYVNFDLEVPEGCDDFNLDGGDGCDASCQLERGWSCEPRGESPTSTSRCSVVCGDSIVVAGFETCDDGNLRAGDGCSLSCQPEVGWSCPTANGDGGACSPVCGDGLVRGTEPCDDGDTTGGDGCSATCTVEVGWSCPPQLNGRCQPVCGDGLVRGIETCDDGDAASLDGCSATCQIELGWTCDVAGEDCAPICGDGIVRGGEGCDDSNTATGDGCSSTCTAEPGWECPASLNGRCRTICGDALVRGTEGCDDDNVVANDGCGVTCQPEAGWTCPIAGGTGGACTADCGDGLVRGPEKCDDGNIVAGDGCNATCQGEDGWACPKNASGAPIGGSCREVCGDGKIVGAETCDDFNALGGDGCDSGCRVEDGWSCPPAGGPCSPICGDGKLRGAETCDEGTAPASDGGCVACRIQSGWICQPPGTTCRTLCGDGITAGAEECDEGVDNGNNADCTLECFVATCDDGLLHSEGTGEETDIDCGGTDPNCARCPELDNCFVRTDCQSNYCDPDALRCEIPLRVPDEYIMKVTDASTDITVAQLLDNDEDDFPDDFNATIGVCGAVSEINGTVTFDPDLGTACVPPTSPNTPYNASFTYEVCSPDFPDECSLPATVTITINRAPSLTPPAQCVAAGTTNQSLNITGSFTDPDGDGLDNTSVEASFVTATPVTGDDDCADATGSVEVTGSSVKWTPADIDRQCTYQISIQACDDAMTDERPYDGSLCTGSATWPVTWQDQPSLVEIADDDAQHVFVSDLPDSPSPAQIRYFDDLSTAKFFVANPPRAVTVEISGSITGPYFLEETTLIADSADGTPLGATVTVDDTNGFPNSGSFVTTTTAGPQVVTYTSKTLNTFDGCTGGTGNLIGNNEVALAVTTAQQGACVVDSDPGGDGDTTFDGRVTYTSRTSIGPDACYARVCDNCEGILLCSTTRLPFDAVGRPDAVDDSGALFNAVAGSPTEGAVGEYEHADMTLNDDFVDTATFALFTSLSTTATADANLTASANIAVVSTAGFPFPPTGVKLAVTNSDNQAQTVTCTGQTGGTTFTGCTGGVGTLSSGAAVELDPTMTQCGGTLTDGLDSVVYLGPVGPTGDCATEDVFAYQVCTDTPDVWTGEGAPPSCDTAFVTITTNQLPVADPDTIQTNEDAPITIGESVLIEGSGGGGDGDGTGDTDGDGDELHVFSVQNPQHGTVSLNAGMITFTPTGDFNGVDPDVDLAQFEYTVTDGKGGFDDATVTVNVVPVNDAPLLDNSVDPTLANIAEDAGNPSNGDEVGTLVSGLVDVSGTWSNFSDVDIGDSDAANPLGRTVGIALIGDDRTNGDWYFSTNCPAGGGTCTWTKITGVVNDSKAIVLKADAGTRVFFAPDQNFVGSATISFRAWDNADNKASGTGNINISSPGGTSAYSSATDIATVLVVNANDPPVSNNDSVTTDEDTPVVLTVNDFGTFSDPDNVFTEFAAIRITTLATAGTLEYDNGSFVAVTDEQVIVRQDIIDGKLRFRPADNGNDGDSPPYATAGFRVCETVDCTTEPDFSGGPVDSGTQSLADYTLSLFVNSVNDAPVGTSNSDVVIDEDQTYPFSVGSFGFTDPNDTPPNSLFAVVLTTLPASDGVLKLGGTTITSAGTEVALADIATLTFVPNDHVNGNDLGAFTFQVRDNGGTALGGVNLDATPRDFKFDITAVNDPPVNTVPGSQTIGEDESLVFSSGNANQVSVSDLDAGSNLIDVMLTVTNGTLMLSTTTGLSFEAGSDDSAMMTVRGTISDINTAMNGMTYTPTAEFNGAASLTINTSDRGFTGTGGTLTDEDSVTINVTGDNDPPVNTVPLVTQQIDEDTTEAIAGVSVNDVDGNLSSTKLEVDNGTVDVSLAGGALISAGANNSATLTLVGTQAQINAALATLEYRGNLNFNGADTLTVTSTDALAATDVDDVQITVAPIDDPPVNTVPGAQSVNEDVSLSLSTVSVTDPDGNLDTVKLTATSTVTVTLQGGATITDGANGSATLTLSGTEADINATLATLSFKGDLNYNGPASLTVLSTDTTAGTPLTDEDVISITINAVNDAPTIENLSDTLVYQDGASPAPKVDQGGDAVFDDVDVASSTTAGVFNGWKLTVTITGYSNAAGNADSLSITTSALITTGGIGNIKTGAAPPTTFATSAFDTADGILTVTFNANATEELIQEVLRNITFANTAPNLNPSRTLTFTIDDLATTNPEFQAVVATVIDANDQPTLVATGGAKTYVEDAGPTDLYTVTSLSSAQTSPTVAEPTQTITDLVLTVTNVTDADERLHIDGSTITLAAGSGTTSTNQMAYTVTTNGLVEVSLHHDDGVAVSDMTTLIENIGYSNTNQHPTEAGRVVTITRIDDSGPTSTDNPLHDNTASPNIAATVTVSRQNDAPVLDDGQTPVLNAIGEDAGAPTGQGAVGTPITSLVDFVTGGSTLNNVTDDDGDAVLGIALVGTQGNGTWWYSVDNGTTWTMVGAVATNSALLIAAGSGATSGRLYFEAAPANNGGTITDAIEFHAWDTTNGSNGTKVDPGTTGGTSAFSIDTDVADQVVTGVNDAPVLDDDGVDPTLNAINEDTGAPTGGSTTNSTPISMIADLVGGGGTNNVTDADGASVPLGVAIKSADETNGDWYYSIDAGDTWIGIPTGGETDPITDTHALLLDGADLLYFHPDGDWNGTTTVTFHAWDETSTAQHGEFINTNSEAGGSKSLSTDDDTAALTVNAVNDAPTFTGSLVTPLEADEDTAEDVDLSGLAFSDVDIESGDLTVTLTTQGGEIGAAPDSITIVGAPGSSVSFTGTIAELETYFNTTTNVSFRGAENVNGDGADTIAVKMNDNMNTGGESGDVSIGTITVNIAAANDAPTFTGSLTTPLNATEDVAANVDLNGITFSDVDIGSGELTITFTTQQGGTVAAAAGTGISVGGTGAARTVTGTLSDLHTYFDTTTNVQFTGAENANGTNADQIVVTMNDNENSPTGDDSGDVSLGTIQVDITAVNDPPVRTGGSVVNLTVFEDSTPPTSLGLGGLAYSTGPSDESGQTITTYQVTAVPNSATLGDVVLSDDTTVVTAGPTTYSLAQIQGMKFRPALNQNGGPANFTWTVKDDGGTSPGVDTLTETLTITVTPVNDAPLRTAGTVEDLTVNENTGLTSLGLASPALTYQSGPNETGQTPLVYTVITIPSSLGTVYLGDGTTPVTAATTYTITQLRAMQFMPTASTSGGPAAFTWTVKDTGGTDNGGVDTLTETINITVNGAPSSANVSLDVEEEVIWTLSPMSFGPYSDPEGDLFGFVEIVTAPTVGTLEYDDGGGFHTVVDSEMIPITDVMAGMLQYDPGTGTGAPFDSLAFKVADVGGAYSADTYTMTINVHTNGAPTSANNTKSIANNDIYTFTIPDFGFGDADPGDVLAIVTVSSFTGSGVLKVGGSTPSTPFDVTAMEIINGDFVYDATGVSDTSSSFDFTVKDQHGAASATSTMTLNVGTP